MGLHFCLDVGKRFYLSPSGSRNQMWRVSSQPPSRGDLRRSAHWHQKTLPLRQPRSPFPTCIAPDQGVLDAPRYVKHARGSSSRTSPQSRQHILTDMPVDPHTPRRRRLLPLRSHRRQRVLGRPGRPARTARAIETRPALRHRGSVVYRWTCNRASRRSLGRFVPQFRQGRPPACRSKSHSQLEGPPPSELRI